MCGNAGSNYGLLLYIIHENDVEKVLINCICLDCYNQIVSIWIVICTCDNWKRKDVQKWNVIWSESAAKHQIECALCIAIFVI